jgi:hypothetical protein
LFESGLGHLHEIEQCSSLNPTIKALAVEKYKRKFSELPMSA